jgi:hypothetical protein
MGRVRPPDSSAYDRALLFADRYLRLLLVVAGRKADREQLPRSQVRHVEDARAFLENPALTRWKRAASAGAGVLLAVMAEAMLDGVTAGWSGFVVVFVGILALSALVWLTLYP